MTTDLQTTESRKIVPQEGSALPATPGREFHLQPAVDIFEDGKGFTIHADLPGVARDGLNVHVEGDTLVIEGRSSMQLPEGARPVYAEQRALNFRRRFTLSSELDADKIEARLANGVLMLTIPKTAAAQPRKIEVKAG